MAPKVLVILTSHDKLGDTGKPTGWFLPEFAHPHDVLTSASFSITTASPNGGLAPLDPASIEMYKEDASSTSFLANKKSLWENTEKLSTFLGRADEFDAVFVPGGHGPMFDLAVDEMSQKVIAEFADKGKVVAAVCHGPGAFVNVRLAGGEHLLEGKEVTGFSNAEEEIMGLTAAMPFLLEDKVKAEGGKFVKAEEPWGAKVVVDGKLITGQNPASATGVGEAIVKAVKGG
ncbi:class I glutamine amidotransferase-like protein [Podospora aff. communis PSN243]|uniref:D-lactate dehydratase n=1 Tax=Podospora aff. communis PSN243 TaxID=3040156 RepID=A0AAV9GJ35_9PEZI|nr:class I glutamine amidotransferase-like protein [Podospora aff. communis PSN243]